MEINSENWNTRAKVQNASFLQSWEWGQIYEKETGQVAVRFNSSKTQALFLEKNLFLGKKYWYAPRLLTSFTNKDLQEKIQGKSDLVFVRIEPANKNVYTRVHTSVYTKTVKVDGIQPAREWLLSLNKPEDELLRGMKSKTRYNIRLSKRKGVVVREVKAQKDFEAFYSLIKKTSSRQEFGLHSKKHYEIIQQIGQASKTVRTFLAEQNGKAVAGAMISFFGKEAYYLHGGSDYESRNLMAPFLLHWEIIKIAKEMGLRRYNFGGVDEKKWPGITRFKQGFGGKEAIYPESFDIILQPFWYRLYKLAKFVRKR